MIPAEKAGKCGCASVGNITSVVLRNLIYIIKSSGNSKRAIRLKEIKRSMIPQLKILLEPHKVKINCWREKIKKLLGSLRIYLLIGVRTMEGDSSINPPLTLLARWVFIVTIILVLSTFPLYDCSRHFQLRHVPLVSKEATFSKCNSAEQDQYVKSKSQPATGSMFDEPRGLSTVSTAATRSQLNEPKTILSSGHAKKRDRNFHPFIAQAASRHHLDPALIKAIIMAESSFDPTAISRKGAKGLMQLMPKTAKALGVEDSFNAEDNINAGVRYLKLLMNRFNGDVRLALAAYNAGTRKVKEFQGIPPIKATHEYIKKVLEYHLFYKEQMAGETGSL